MKPIIKWTGGKRREIKTIQNYLPRMNFKLIEPFVGGGALFFHFGLNGSVINDYDFNLINFYNHIDDPKFKEHIKEYRLSTEHDDMEALYYKCREHLNVEDLSERAANFVYVNQLAFSGMRRFNKSGGFNVPFGHYKNFALTILPEHRELLRNTTIRNECAMSVIKDYDHPDTFVFLDPPYTREFKTYSHDNVFDMTSQTELRDTLANLNHAKWMLVINQDDAIEELYKDFDIQVYSLKYGVNIKNRFDTKVNHLLIRNYT